MKSRTYLYIVAVFFGGIDPGLAQSPTLP